MNVLPSSVNRTLPTFDGLVLARTLRYGVRFRSMTAPSFSVPMSRFDWPFTSVRLAIEPAEDDEPPPLPSGSFTPSSPGGGV